MSKSQFPRWFNPTGDDLWDEYYANFWVLMSGLAILIIGIIVGANL